MKMGGMQYLRALTMTLISLELVLSFQQLIFGVLGRMWLSVSVNSLNLGILALSLRGIHSKNVPAICLSILWCTIWLLWNILAILVFQNIINYLLFYSMFRLYLPDSASWWYNHGFNCIPTTSPSDKHSLVNDNADTSNLPVPRVLAVSQSMRYLHSSPMQMQLSPRTPELLPLSMNVTEVPGTVPPRVLTSVPLLRFTDPGVDAWFLPSNHLPDGLCWPDFQHIETAQAAVQVLLSILLILVCACYASRVKQRKRYEMHRGELAFISMPRSQPFPKTESISSGLHVGNTLRREASQPLLTPCSSPVGPQTNLGGVGGGLGYSTTASHTSVGETVTHSNLSSTTHDTDLTNGPLLQPGPPNGGFTLINRQTGVSNTWGTKSLQLRAGMDNAAPHEPSLDHTEVVLTGSRPRGRRKVQSTSASLATLPPGGGHSPTQLEQLKEHSRWVARMLERTPSGEGRPSHGSVEDASLLACILKDPVTIHMRQQSAPEGHPRRAQPTASRRTRPPENLALPSPAVMMPSLVSNAQNPSTHRPATNTGRLPNGTRAAPTKSTAASFSNPMLPSAAYVVEKTPTPAPRVRRKR